MEDKINFWWRLRLFIGGELSRLASWFIPRAGSGGCDELAEWIIVDGHGPDDYTHACTFHLPDMVTKETARIERLAATTLCCYVDTVQDVEWQS